MSNIYVSNTGDNNFPGTLEYPVKDIATAISMCKSGDNILLHANQKFQGGFQIAVDDVSISTYGEGEFAHVTNELGLNTTHFTQYATNVWRIETSLLSNYRNASDRNIGAIVTPDGHIYGNKVYSIENLQNNFDFISGEVVVGGVDGFIYVYCDNGEPFDLYPDLILTSGNTTGALISIIGDNVTVSNLQLEYCSQHAIAPGTNSDLTITNCIFNTIGGGTLSGQTRYGNGVEITVSIDGCYIKNNFFKNIFDCCVTVQGSNWKANNIVIENNYAENIGQFWELWGNNVNTETLTGLKIISNVIKNCGFCFDPSLDKVGCAFYVYNVNNAVLQDNYINNNTIENVSDFIVGATIENNGLYFFLSGMQIDYNKYIISDKVSFCADSTYSTIESFNNYIKGNYNSILALAYTEQDNASLLNKALVLGMSEKRYQLNNNVANSQNSNIITLNFDTGSKTFSIYQPNSFGTIPFIAFGNYYNGNKILSAGTINPTLVDKIDSGQAITMTASNSNNVTTVTVECAVYSCMSIIISPLARILSY